ncbi:uncharacterized protein LOC119689857 [Teleopsis dalmanni]|uniref:uncharacterized protein LOC119689857 n=1 Tax=Teleopsis dalmanni TaxID=139649 RepID=UPI0018CDAD75|nr:uncharacterized protein LOC119689857 [Teleopsis dalmanni]
MSIFIDNRMKHRTYTRFRYFAFKPKRHVNEVFSVLRHTNVNGKVQCGIHNISGPLFLVCFSLIISICEAVPTLAGNASQLAHVLSRRSWPSLKHYDIWNSDFADSSGTDNSIDTRDADIDFEILNKGNNFQIISESFTTNAQQNQNSVFNETLYNISENAQHQQLAQIYASSRKSKVIHLFPVPVDGECVSDDGRRTGSCFNPYECRMKGGSAKGECAMGFGVCCIFIANCNETIIQNLTYIVSPNFPSFMPSNFSSCTMKVKILNEDISQLRIDFYHFSLGQPNRRSGICDGDIFNVTGGPAGTFSLCGQNSGQHIYYDVGGKFLPRQTLYGTLRPLTYNQIYPNLNASEFGNGEQLIEISLNFSKRFLPIRLWEIRIAQIPFSLRAPAGCLQYHTSNEGIIQTFNFADNGRHLANQHYRICMRQEIEMCSIVYQPCDEQSFRIGPSIPVRTGIISNGAIDLNTMGSIMNMNTNNVNNNMLFDQNVIMSTTMPQESLISQTTPFRPTNIGINMTSPTTMLSVETSSTAMAMPITSTTLTTPSTSTIPTTSTMSIASNAPDALPTTELSATTAVVTTTPSPPAASTSSDTDAAPAPAPAPAPSPAPPPESSTASPVNNIVSTTTTTTIAPQLSDDIDGSGDGSDISVTPSTGTGASRRPQTTSGGFDLLGFLRTAFALGFRNKRNARQFYSTCSDRITMPCIIEDFINIGLGPLPGCEPVHCGFQFCSSGVWPCMIESTVTPFYIGIHFGNGIGKGSAEDNIGACLRFKQVQCP